MKKIALLLLFMVLHANTFALESGITETGLSYNEVGIGYGVQGNTGGDYKGFGIGGQALLTKNIFAFGQLSMPSANLPSVTVDNQSYIAGLGARTAIATNADLYGSISYMNSEYTFAGTSLRYTGYSLSTGFNALVAPKLEAGLSVSYSDSQSRTETVTETRYNAGLGYRLADKLMGRASYYTTSDQSGYSVSLNYLF